ncbi:hypothetical protein ABZX75_32730 [Streptomyces sp. NPDC003038]|uniref:hypothetical protein n=1 Tax=unclassified Streptomyces TaxID=2593676 RepID=UPI0033B91285
MHPEFDRAAVLAWLPAHDEIVVPAKPESVFLLFVRPGGGTRALRLDDPRLALPQDASGEDRLSPWDTGVGVGALATLTDGAFGVALSRLTVAGRACWPCR